MVHGNRTQKQSNPNQSAAGSLHALPLVILALGLITTAMFIGVVMINDRQLINFGTANTLMDIQVLTTSSHLWLEETLGGDTKVDIEDVWAELNLAIALGEALLKGGKSEHGLDVYPLKNKQFRNRVERINTLLDLYKIGVQKKSQQDSIGFLDSAQDDDFDTMYRRIQRETLNLEKIIEKNQLAIQNRSRQLITGIFISWALILCVGTLGLWRHASRRQAMEESLKNANSQLNAKTEELRQHQKHLMDLVDVRTIALSSRNKQLLQEITERKKMHEALIQSQKRSKKLYTEFNTLAKAISDPIVLLSPGLDVLWTNNIPGPCSDDGIAAAKGQKCHPFSLDQTQLCEGCSAMRSFDSGVEETSHSVTPDGRIWEVRAYPVKNEQDQVTGVLTMSADVTKKIKLQAETMRAAHLASLGEMAAGVAHEINNPINGVINYAQMLIDERRKANEDYDIQNRILKEGRRIAGIVKSLLSFAREGKEVREYIGIHEILTDTLALSAAQLRKDGIRLELDVSTELPRIFAHFQQIQQVFLNLINNARYALNQKFVNGNENKVLTISAAAVSRNNARVVKVTFMDQGTGIPADIIDKVFNPFFSTKPRGVGTGLGLSISHGIATDHGGEITIDSSAGNYTKIDVILPTGTKHE
jgi:two-component system, NtrC family, sensor kinase